MKNNKINKKGQAEFFGLVIIVFLLSIGLIFLISLNKEDTNSVKSSYLDQVLSQDFINSILNMRTECKEGILPGLKLSQLITDCAEGGKGINCENGMDSCMYVNKTIEILLNNTFELWKKAYYFNISNTEIVFYTNDTERGACTPNRKVDREPPGTQPFPTRSGFGLIFMMICKI